MLKGFVAALSLLCALGTTAVAEIIPVPNGSFEANTPLPATGGFTQAITAWNVSYSGDGSSTPSGPTTQTSGIFSSFSSYTATDGQQFVGLFNLGAGTVSFSTMNVFLLTQRSVQFDAVFLANDPPNTGNDAFTVVIDIFSDAAETNLITSITQVVNMQSNTATITGAAPFSPAGSVYAHEPPTNYTTVTIPIPQYYLNYARITFLVDNTGPAQSGSNFGVTGVFLDNVVLSPEPSTMALFGLGILGLGGIALRRRRKNATPQA